MTFDDYTKAHGLNASKIGAWLTDPLDCRDMCEGVQKNTPALATGRLLHSLVFEPRWAESHYIIRPDTYTTDKGEEKSWNNNATACREWTQAQGDGQIVSSDVLDGFREQARVIRAHKDVKPLVGLTGGKREHSVFADCPRFGALKCRFDYIDADKGVAVDLKTMRDVTDAGMSKAIAQYHYWVKAAFYIHVAKCAGIEIKEFWFIGVRLTDPIRINVKRLDAMDISAGSDEFARVIPEISAAQLSGNWPDPSGGKITMPEWAWDKWTNEQINKSYSE
jgi:hypothetical protein